MTNRKNCIYCNKEITTRSREHVIQNALGGLYESEDICCPECNNYISRHIDAPFTCIFNPILGNIGNMVKTNNKKSTPAYTATVSYNGQTYNDANVKAGKIIGCPSLSKQLKCDASKLPLKIESYNFNLENSSFKTGMAKIAFNYALASGIDFKLIKSGLKITKTGNDISKIEYDYPLIPFYPMNPVDTFIELGTPTELYHNMILFSQSNQLWCYIDLFNTFQYYVLLSDTAPDDTKIYHSYAQTLQKYDRSEPKISIFSPKDAMIYAQQYGVEPCMDEQELTRRIRNAIATKSQKLPIDEIISKKIPYMSILSIMQTLQNPQLIMQFGQCMPLYFDDNDKLNTETFRITTPSIDGKHIMSYPDAILEMTSQDKSQLAQYTTAKFNKLNAFLCKPGR